MISHLAYTPFLSPMPLWDYWWALALPLCVGVSIVYKSIKCSKMEEVPRAAAGITFWIIAGMGAVGLGISALMWWLSN